MPNFELFFSDDGAAILSPRSVPQVQSFSFSILPQIGPSFLRGGASSMVPVVESMPCMACSADLQELCPAGDAAMDEIARSFFQQMCLMRHKRALSFACSAFLDAQEENLVSMCYQDIDGLCQGVLPGDHRVHDCLWSNRRSVSERCMGQLEESAPKLGGREEDLSGEQPNDALQSNLEGIWQVIESFFGAPKKNTAKDAGSLGGDPDTWPPKVDEQLAEDSNEPLNDAVASDLEIPSDPANEGEGFILGSNLETGAPASKLPPRSFMGFRPQLGIAAAGSPGLIGGDPATWTPKDAPKGSDAESTGVVGGDPVTWTPDAGKGESKLASVFHTARNFVWAGNGPKQRDMAAAALAAPTAEDFRDGNAAPLRSVVAAGLTVVGGAGLVFLAAITSRAVRRQSARARSEEWQRFIAPSLVT